MPMLWRKPGGVTRSGTGVFASAFAAVLLLWAAAGAEAAPAVGTPIVNTVLVQFGDANGNPLPSVRDTISAPIAGAPLLRVTQQSDTDPVAPGAVQTYTIEYENGGNAAATGITIVDALPSGVVFQSASSGGVYSAANHTITWTIDNLTSGSAGTLTAQVVVDPGLPSDTVITNLVTIASAELEPVDARLNTVVGLAANLLFTKTASPESAVPGGVITYSLTAHNIGNLDAFGVRVTDSMPAGTAYVADSATDTPELTYRALSWSLGTIPQGEQKSVEFQVSVSPIANPGDRIVNLASLVSDTDAKSSNPVTTYVASQPQMTLTMEAPDTTQAGLDLTYTIHVANSGDVPLTDVVLRDVLPAGILVVAADRGGVASSDGTQVEWSLGTLAVGATESVTLTVQVDLALAGSLIENSVSATTNELPPQTVAAVTAVDAVDVDEPALILTMVALDRVRAGSDLIYTIEVTNSGSIPLTNLLLEDLLPPGAEFVSADGGGILSEDGTHVVWAIGTLDVGMTRSLTLTEHVDPSLIAESLIENSVDALCDELPPASAVKTTVVDGRTHGTVEFFDANWQPAYGFREGNLIHLQVSDADQNMDPAAVETVVVVVDDLATGDTETVVLTETGPNTGVFRTAEGLATTRSQTASDDGTLTVAADSEIQAVYTDALDASPVSTALALIDPLGIIFDSVTGEAIAGTIVTLREWNNASDECDYSSVPTLPPSEINPAIPTGADGRFAFPLVPPGDFCFQVDPAPGYLFPSLVPDADLPEGFIIGVESRGGKFTLSVGDPPLIRDVPVDPPPGQLTISMGASKAMVTIGEFIGYSIKLSTSGGAPVTGIKIENLMPHGVEYLPGSSRLNGEPFADPEPAANGTLVWTVADLTPGESIEITYRAVIGPDSPRGSGINRVSANGTTVGEPVSSNQASVKVKISAGVFTDNGTIVGKIYLDHDGNGIQREAAATVDPSEADEPGIPDVVLYLEDGTRVITDRAGKYSLLGVLPGTHVLRVDETTLPPGLSLQPLSNRFAGEGSSQFVAMSPGGLSKADFAASSIAGPGAGMTSPQMEESETLPADSEVALTELREPTKIDWESEIKSMDAALAFVTPLDGENVARDRIRVLLKAPLGTTLSLSVSGVSIDAAQIGRKMDYEDGGVTLYEYVDVHLNGGTTNLLQAEVRDSFGIVRGTAQVEVNVAGASATLLIESDKLEAPADGAARIGFTVSLRDGTNQLVPYTGSATVAASAGEIDGQDADAARENFQVVMAQGVGHFSLIAPRETGEVVVRVQADRLEEEAKVFFTPDLRPLMVVGMGEFVLGRGAVSGDSTFLSDTGWMDEGAYSGGRGALFIKGKLPGDYLLTSTYDSHKKVQDELFRQNERDLDSEDKYPIYGDESKSGHEAMSADRLYLKLEKNRSYLLYGDYRTELNDTRLAAYNRSFNGIKQEFLADGFRLSSFASYTDQTQVVDALPGRGISGNYYLTRHPVMEGSDRLVIEIRDRQRPDHVLSRETRMRGTDYEIDYDLGAILMKEPVPSHDGDYNPVYMIVSYESRSEGERYYSYGGRAAVELLKGLEVGVTGIVEEQAVGDYRLVGSDLTLTLPRKTTLKMEYAETRAFMEEEGLFSWRDDSAWAAEIESQPVKALVLNAYYRDLGRDFFNLSTVDASRGTTRYGLDGVWEVGTDTRVKGRFFNEEDDLNSMTHEMAAFGVQTSFGEATKLGAEISRETSNDHYIPMTSPNTRSPFDISLETPDALTALELTMETELRDDLSLNLGHKQNIGNDNYRRSQAGLNYQLNTQDRIYLRQELQKFEDRSDTRTLIGVETQRIRNTVAYNEYRLADGADGSRNQDVIGLRSKLALGERLTANITTEYLKTLSGDQHDVEPDAAAVALALEYLPSEALKVTSRLEHRRELADRGLSSWLGEVGLAYKLNPDVSLLLRERYFTELAGTGDRHTTSRMMAGLAYRPLLNNRLNAFTKLEYKQEANAAAVPSVRETAWIFSGESVWQQSRRLQLMTKYAGKLSTDKRDSAYTDLVAMRVLYDLTERWDFGAEYRILEARSVNSTHQGGSVELGFRVVRNLWIAAGYSFDEFDTDLTGGYEGKGPFIKLRFKFDERIARRSPPESNDR